MNAYPQSQSVLILDNCNIHKSAGNHRSVWLVSFFREHPAFLTLVAIDRYLRLYGISCVGRRFTLDDCSLFHTVPMPTYSVSWSSMMPFLHQLALSPADLIASLRGFAVIWSYVRIRWHYSRRTVLGGGRTQTISLPPALFSILIP